MSHHVRSAATDSCEKIKFLFLGWNIWSHMRKFPLQQVLQQSQSNWKYLSTIQKSYRCISGNNQIKTDALYHSAIIPLWYLDCNCLSNFGVFLSSFSFSGHLHSWAQICCCGFGWSQDYWWSGHIFQQSRFWWLYSGNCCVQNLNTSTVRIWNPTIRKHFKSGNISDPHCTLNQR